VQQDASPEATEDSYYGEFVIATFSANILLLLVVFVCYVNFVLIKPYLSPLLWAFFFSFALQVFYGLQSVCEPFCSRRPLCDFLLRSSFLDNWQASMASVLDTLHVL
jgi:hypothetical protein